MVEIILPSCFRSAPRSPFSWIYPEITSQGGIHVGTGYSKWRTSSSTLELLWGTQASYPALKATPTLQRNEFCTLINISTLFYQSPPAARDRMWELKRKPTDKKKRERALPLGSNSLICISHGIAYKCITYCTETGWHLFKKDVFQRYSEECYTFIVDTAFFSSPSVASGNVSGLDY